MVEGGTFSGMIADEVAEETWVPAFLDWYCVADDESTAEKAGTEDHFIRICVGQHDAIASAA
jgi:hypothetical protein